MDLSECSIPKDEWIRALVICLGESKEYSVRAGLDHHFISEIDHLIQTADANMDGEGICDNCKHAVWEDGEIFDCRKEPICDPGVPSDHKCCNGKFDRKEENND